MHLDEEVSRNGQEFMGTIDSVTKNKDFSFEGSRSSKVFIIKKKKRIGSSFFFSFLFGSQIFKSFKKGIKIPHKGNHPHELWNSAFMPAHDCNQITIIVPIKVILNEVSS